MEEARKQKDHRVKHQVFLGCNGFLRHVRGTPMHPFDKGGRYVATTPHRFMRASKVDNSRA